MAYDLEEQEQIDQLRAWWSKYGNSVLTVLVIALAVLAAWRGWQWYQGHQATQARGYFEALEEVSRQQGGEDDVARINAAMKTLRDDYARTDYAVRGALIAASALEAHKDSKAAQAQLQWVVQSDQVSLVPVAKLRLAGLLLDAKEYDAALAELKDPPAAFAALYADRQGDIFSAQGKVAEARSAWQKALGLMGDSNALTPLVKLKLDALGA